MQVKPLADHRLREGEDFIDDLAGVIEAQGMCEEFTAVEELELFVKNAQCSKSLLRCLLSLEHEPTGHVNVLARYGMPLDTLCELMLEHRVMFKAPAKSMAGGGGGGGGGGGSAAGATEAGAEEAFIIPTKLPTERPTQFDTTLKQGQLSCTCRVKFTTRKDFPPGLVEMTMAALQDVDEELPLQTFYRFGGVFYNQVDERRKALFYFEYPELVLQVHGRCGEDDVGGKQELFERLGRMKERVKTVAQVFKGLVRRGLGPKAKVEFAAFDAESAAAAARPKVHASFATRMNSASMQSVMQQVHEAGCEWTTDHIQTEAWFEEWSRKAQDADFLLVLFTPEYKNLYSWALEREADMIRQVCEK